jgi:SAM-dependent methyltransferase
VATDTDVRFLKVLEFGNLEVLQHNVASDALEHGAFDLVHARDVLAHIPEREAVLAKMADAVRPGGWILVEEPDVSTERADPLSPEPTKLLHLKVVRAIHAFLCESGVDPFIGSRLFGMLRTLGFDSLSSEGRVHTFRGRPAGAEAPHMMAFEQLRQAVVLKGAVTEEEFQRFLDLSHNPAFAWREALTVSARGRRPEGSRL